MTILEFIYLFALAVLGLRCCAWAFSSGKQGLLSSCGVQAAHGAGCFLERSTGSEHEFHSCSAWALIAL